MDEIFHISQAQQYCQGNYGVWDPKLTTPPGLYVISLGLKAIGELFNIESICSIEGLRATNLLFAFLLYFVLAALSSQLHPNKSLRQHSYHAFLLTWFPVSFFYYFLYYTDTGSTLFVLLSYLGVKTERYLVAGLMGALAVTFRQTNIVWVLYFMVLSIVQLIQTRNAMNNRTSVPSSSSPSSSPSSSTLYNPACDKVESAWDILQSVLSLLRFALGNLIYIVPRILTFIVTLVGFCAFLVWNDGIVLGDKSNHMPGLHIPQLFYYTSFLSFFSAPLCMTWNGMKLLLSGWNVKSLLLGIASIGLMIYAAHYHTYEHPFILSDNRHYSFYVWKKIYRRHWLVRYALTPFYFISIKFNQTIIATHVSVLWMLGYVIALVLTLVPSPLLEFRYFILPFLMFCIHIPPPSLPNFYITLVAYSLINIIVLYLFIYHPFIWPQNPGEWQRFMW
ncbi:unnamed protein product [Absidia cylindrospora]